MTAAPSRVGLIGDVHAECARLEIALDHFADRGIDTVLCTGDVADGKGCVDRACRLLEERGVLCVAGNHERWILGDRVRHIPDAHTLDALDDRSRAFLDGLPRTLDVPTRAGLILLCHGIGETDHRKIFPGTERVPVEPSEELDAIIAAGRHRILVNGHLHYRMIVDFGALTLINAGTLKRNTRSGFVELDLDADLVRFNGFDDALNVHEQAVYPFAAHSRRVFRDTRCFDGNWTPFPLFD